MSPRCRSGLRILADRSSSRFIAQSPMSRSMRLCRARRPSRDPNPRTVESRRASRPALFRRPGSPSFIPLTDSTAQLPVPKHVPELTHHLTIRFDRDALGDKILFDHVDQVFGSTHSVARDAPATGHASRCAAPLLARLLDLCRELGGWNIVLPVGGVLHHDGGRSGPPRPF